MWIMEYFFRFSLSISWNKGKNGLSKLELFNLSHFYLILKSFLYSPFFPNLEN